MSTNATISRLLEDGTVLTIYSHWDGYPEGVGRVLVESYNTEAQVQDLVAQGDVSVLDDTIGDSEFYRDRGEDNTEAENFELYDIEDCEEYNYLWAHDEWLFSFQGVWYRLAYYLEAELEDVHSYIRDKNPEIA